MRVPVETQSISTQREASFKNSMRSEISVPPGMRSSPTTRISMGIFPRVTLYMASSTSRGKRQRFCGLPP